MKLKILLSTLILMRCFTANSENFNSDKLDQLFNSLEQRNEAMASISISKNGKLIYERAIGYRSVNDTIKVKADTHTNYRIWSITKTYTATMIMQLIEEGKLSLNTTLDNFYPEIPNAQIITIRAMLKHKSGIHDFTQNDTGEEWNAHIKEPLTHAFMVKNIAQYSPDFLPGEDFRYSNSNYLILGYIIEEIDGNLYERSLYDRISSRIGLTSTYFGVGALDQVPNKANSYQFHKKWQEVDEGAFSGLIPAGAGGIVSTPSDMRVFIEALFKGELISENSLNVMLPVDEFYGMGIMRNDGGQGKDGFGHSGGFIASESSLFYFPKDSLAIAYATNGLVLRKEEILAYVWQIYHDKPFSVSMNRVDLMLIISGIAFLLYILLQWKFKQYLKIENLVSIGIFIALVFWISVYIAGSLYGDYSHIKDEVTILDKFYSNSGTFMSAIQLIITILFIPLLFGLYKSCKQFEINPSPIVSLVFIPISMTGASFFPIPNELYTLFVNVIILTIAGPLLAIVLWRKKAFIKMRLWSLVALFLMISAICLLISRSVIPEFIHSYRGIIQRLLFLGWTFWLVVLSFFFTSLHKQGKEMTIQ